MNTSPNVLHSAVVSAVVGTILPGASLAQAPGATPRALLFTEAGTLPSLLPGRSDGAAVDSFSLGELHVGPQGQAWVITAGTTHGLAIISGDRTEVRTVAMQDEPLPGLGLAFDRNPDLPRTNDQGRFAFGMVILGGSAIDRVAIAAYDPETQTYGLVARQREPIPGIDVDIPDAAGELWGSSLNPSAVLPDGRVALVARSTSGPLPTDRDEMLLVAGDPVDVLAQLGVLVPGGQDGGGAFVLNDLNRRAWLSADGSSWLISGSVAAAANDDVVVVDGDVVMQEGRPIAGLTGAVFAPTAFMYPGGDWAIRGTTTDGERYLIVNGVLRAKGGEPVPGLGTPAISSISGIAMNARGDLAYEATLVDGNRVIVVDPVSREPFFAVQDDTPVDIPGGSARGPLNYGNPLSLEPALADDGTLYFVARVQDASGLNVADGLFVMSVDLGPGPCSADINADGLLDLLDILGFFGLFAAGDAAANFDPSNPGLDLFDVLAYFDAFAAGCA